MVTRRLTQQEQDALQDQMTRPMPVSPEIPDSAACDEETDPTLNVEQKHSGLAQLGGGRYTLNDDDNAGEVYHVVPARMNAAMPSASKPRWTIELCFDNLALPPL